MDASPFKENCLAGKVALITGGGSGIGFEIARQLGLHGAAVVLMGRREAPLRSAAGSLAAEGIQAGVVTGDVRNYDDCTRAVSAAVTRFGRLDVLVNNAAGNFLASAQDLSPNAFRTVLDIDAMGVFNMSKAAFSDLKMSGDALILNITATLHYGATWFQMHASAAKAAIDAITKTLALEWGEYRIRVNGIAPGPIAGTAGLTKLGGGNLDKVAKRVPIRRVGTTQDIALTSVFLASRAGAYINGDTLVVDGGLWLSTRPLAPKDQVREFARQIEQKSRATGIAGSGSKL